MSIVKKYCNNDSDFIGEELKDDKRVWFFKINNT